MPEIFTVPDKKSVNADPAQTILDAMVDGDIPITNACGGQAHCSTCRVMVLDGIDHCSAPTDAERALAKKLQLPVHVRLACQTSISGGDVYLRRLVINDEDLNLIDSQLETGHASVEQPLVILQASIRGANNFDEVNFPYDIAFIMSRYFQRMQRVITSYGGQINNFMGGRLVAIFDKPGPDWTLRAVWAALEMQESLSELNQLLEQLSYHPLNLSIGVHYGQAILVPTNPGRTKDMMPLGDAVSVVQRVDMANKTLGTKILISHTVFATLASLVEIDKVGEIPLSGKGERKIKVYETLKLEGPRPDKLDWQANGPVGKKVRSWLQRFGWFNR